MLIKRKLVSGGISYQPNATDSIYEDDVYADNDDDEEEEEEKDRCASNGDDGNRLAAQHLMPA